MLCKICRCYLISVYGVWACDDMQGVSAGALIWGISVYSVLICNSSGK